MPLRLNHIQDRKKPGLAFIFPIELTFSISVDSATEYNFNIAVKNNNEEVSSILRKFLFKSLDIKNKRDFENLIFKDLKNIKTTIYNKLNVSRENPFSQIILKEIKHYIKKNEDK